MRMISIFVLQKLHLYPCLTELGPLAELLPGVDVGVLGPLKGLLQLIQLVSCECCSRPPLLALISDFHSRQMRGLRRKERGERTRERGFENFCFTLRGIPGSASISEPSSDPPPSGLTARASKCETRKQVEAGGKVRHMY